MPGLPKIPNGVFHMQTVLLHAYCNIAGLFLANFDLRFTRKHAQQSSDGHFFVDTWMAAELSMTSQWNWASYYSCRTAQHQPVFSQQCGYYVVFFLGCFWIPDFWISRFLNSQIQGCHLVLFGRGGSSMALWWALFFRARPPCLEQNLEMSMEMISLRQRINLWMQWMLGNGQGPHLRFLRSRSLLTTVSPFYRQQCRHIHH